MRREAATLFPSLRGALAALLFSCAITASAVEPTTPLANYSRQAWGLENGLPQNTVQALVQTQDGFVWLGTEVGLVRFDGNSFQVFDKNSKPALPGNDVRCLLATKDGSLWIGTSEGLAQLKDGVATYFTDKEGLPGNNIERLLDTGEEELWAETDQGLARFNGSHFVRGEGLPDGPISAISLDAGTLWVDGPHGMFIRSKGAWIIPSVAGLPPVGPKFHLRVGSGWAAANNSEVLIQESAVLKELKVGKELPGSKIQALFADREESLWIGTNVGLARWADGKLQTLPVTDPLAHASVLTIMEDHEGDLWVGTEADGLHILRDQRFKTIGIREGLSTDATTTVVEDGARKLWVGTSGSGLNVVRRFGVAPGTASTYAVPDVLLSNVILSLAAAPNGDLWVGTPDGLNRIRGSAVDSFTSADGLPDDFIRSLLVDADGSLWVGTRRGLAHGKFPKGKMGAVPSAGHVETFTQANGLGSDLVGAMTRDKNGDLWVATFAGLSRLHAGKIQNYTTANGLSSNVVTALLAQSNGTLLIGTQDHGWNAWDGKKFSAFNGDGLGRAAIHAILEDGLGHLWFATGNGIARCDCDMAGGCSHWIDFGAGDGLRGRETATNSHPSAWRSQDGHLWFATPKGLVEIDPAHFPVNSVPPPVSLERVTVDDVPQALRGAAAAEKIPAGHVHFEFDYAGLSFVAPQKIRYRYKLDGFDHDWTDAGARRTAYYTNIPPGHYTFRVQAANNDGDWNTEGAQLAFELSPHFYQTIWFYALLVAFAVGMIVLVQKRRLLRAEREFNAVLGERNRIAREIHDTLAQGYVGISVQLEVLSELLRLNKAEAAAKHLDLTRGFVREGLADARQSIWALRSQDSGETTLPVRLRRIVEAENQNGLEASFSIFGAYRSLSPGIEQEILRIAQEAIQNVKKHAGATHLFVQLEYRPNAIALDVRDDGRGFVQSAVSTTGHYGLTGMRERAAAIGGTIEVTSEPGVGTTVRLRAEPREAKKA
jgi:signal transduction histidine kinase/ligand-binding sensor domain-containing protein